MKKIIILGLILVSGCSTYVPLQNDPALTKVAIVSFSISRSGQEKIENENKATGFLPTVISLIQNAEQIKATFEEIQIATTNPSESRLFKMKNSIYTTVESGLIDDLGLPILSRANINSTVSMDWFGFPNEDNPQKFAKTNTFDAVMAIEIQLGSKAQGRSWSIPFLYDEIQQTVYPNLTLYIHMYNNSGKIIWRDKVVVISDEPTFIDEQWIMGILANRDYYSPDPKPDQVESLPKEAYLLKQAMTLLMEKVRY